MTRWRNSEPERAGPVTPVELFFDMVFVFTLTQLTSMLERDLSLAGAGRILLLFGILWWMYGGYAWLTNHVPPRRVSQKLLLFAGMAGFLIAAVGMPRAFAGTGVVFGLGYLVVICVHLILFTQSERAVSETFSIAISGPPGAPFYDPAVRSPPMMSITRLARMADPGSAAGL